MNTCVPPLSVRLTSEMKDALSQFAKDRQKTPSEVIREFVQVIVPTEDRPKPKAANNGRTN